MVKAPFRVLCCAAKPKSEIRNEVDGSRCPMMTARKSYMHVNEHCRSLVWHKMKTLERGLHGKNMDDKDFGPVARGRPWHVNYDTCISAWDTCSGPILFTISDNQHESRATISADAPASCTHYFSVPQPSICHMWQACRRAYCSYLARPPDVFRSQNSLSLIISIPMLCILP